MTERYFVMQGVGVSSADALALLLWERDRFAAPLARYQTASRVLWALPDERFGWDLARVIAGDYTYGFCSECGCGFKTFLFCGGACKWIATGTKPEVEWTSDVEAALLRQRLLFDDPPKTAPEPPAGWVVPG